MEVTIVDINGADTGRKVDLLDDVFGIEPNEHAVYLDVKQYLANQRQGTHKSKQRSEITGSTRKIKKQKGTGTARAGSIKSPIFRGGGRIFGPQPRSYSYKLNKNVKKLARRSALSAKFSDNSLTVIEDFTLPEIKTKSFLNIVKALNVAEKKSLFVLSDLDKNVYLSSRNLPHSEVVTVSQLNTYGLMKASNIIISENALEKIVSNLSS